MSLAPDVSDQHIEDRLRFFEESETEPAERAEFASFLADYLHGAVAEDALERIIARLPQHELEDLVKKYVMRGHSMPGRRYCGPQYSSVVAARLTERGFAVIQGPGWHITWEGGPSLEAAELCPIALLAVWYRGMRRRWETIADDSTE